MFLEKMDKKIKCDASGCKNLSEFKLINKKFTFNGSMYFCGSCLNHLYALIGNEITPKSPTPIFKKKEADFINFSFFDKVESAKTEENNDSENLKTKLKRSK